MNAADLLMIGFFGLLGAGAAYVLFLVLVCVGVLGHTAWKIHRANKAAQRQEE